MGACAGVAREGQISGKLCGDQAGGWAGTAAGHVATMSMRRPIQAITGTAIELPNAL